MTNDGRWTYLWSAENRLIQMETTAAATAAGHPYTKVKAAYDAQGRRISRTVWQGGTSASPTFQSSHRYLYDAWNVVTEFSAPFETSTTLTRQTTLTWGLDLSNTPQGAGGVGGLLSISSIQDPPSSIYYPSYDGNGNILAWSQSNSSTPIARREYDAFGNTLVSEGAWPSSYGFSTKPQDAETGFYYYGHRYYDPVTGRWPSKDPMEEEGGVNLYGFVENDGINKWDILGFSPQDNAPGDRDAMNAVVLNGAIAAHKAAEDEYLSIIRSNNPVVKNPNRVESFRPALAREYGGRVCEICDPTQENGKKYTYYLTQKKGAWYAVADKGTIYLGDEILKCKKGKTIAFWHTHPSSIGKGFTGTGHKRKQIYYWNGAGSFSTPDSNLVNSNDAINPLHLPFFVTYRDSQSSKNWNYKTQILYKGKGTEGQNVDSAAMDPVTWE